MGTLEDKLLGEKLHYYCSSSSEGEEEEEEDSSNEADDSCASKGRSKEGAAAGLCTDSDICPPPPKGGYCSQVSTNTGPKGVVQDWQLFKKLQVERREESERQRVALAKKLTMATTTVREVEEQKRQEEIDVELAELMSEDFLQQFQKQRMAEMLQQRGQIQHFSKVQHLITNTEFLDCVDKASKHTIVVIHIFNNNITACKTLNKCLDSLAIDYSTVKFAKINSAVAGMSREFHSQGLPALLVYKAQTIIGNFVRVTDDLSDDFFPSDVENFLVENDILIEKNLYK